MKANGNSAYGDRALTHGLTAEQIDERMRNAYRVADVSNRTLAFYLADMHERGLHQALGMPSTVAYAEKALGMARRTARELLKAGPRLRELAVIDAAFAESRWSWSRVRRLCEVATKDTESEWLERARTSSQDELDRQVRTARRGDLPPRDGGLPQARFAVHVELDALRWQMWENARAKLRAELPDGAEVRDEDVLLEMARLVLSTDSDGSVPGRKPVDGSVYRVVVAEPRDDRGPTVLTEDGEEPIEEGDFEAAVSDSATPPKLRAEVFARDGHACQNCGSRRNLHAHHVTWRKHGGKNALDNLVTACARCHGLVHDGFLDAESVVAHGAADGAATAFVFRDCHGRRQDRRVLVGPTVSLRAVATPEVAQCAPYAPAPTPAKPDAKWLGQHLDWFTSKGSSLVLKERYRERFEALVAGQ